MTKAEREKLIRAIDHLEHSPCEWEEAMAILYPLAGWIYEPPFPADGESSRIVGGVIVRKGSKE